MLHSLRRAAWFALTGLLVSSVPACGDDDDGGDQGRDASLDASSPRATGEGGRPGGGIVGPGPRAPNVEYELAIIGDSGDTDPSDPEDPTNAGRVAALVESFAPDFIVSVGDQDYTDGEFEGTFKGLELGIGQYYADYIGDYQGDYGDGSPENRFFPVPGDHDYGDDCDNPRLDDYLAYFALPEGPEDETYYTITRGPVQFFFLDSIIDCHGDDGAKLERQRAWVEATAAESSTLFKVAVVHHPPYSSGTQHGSAEHTQWPWADFGIDLVLSGDDHIYERIERDGVTYVINGVGGVELHEIGDPISGSKVRYADEFGAMRAEVFARGMRLSFIDLDGETIDRFTLGSVEEDTPAEYYLPVVETTWQWQLQGSLNSEYDVDVYDIDLFETTAGAIDALHAQGRRVLCYFSAGSYEDFRPDSADFPEDTLGEPLDGFEDERWLDIRAPAVLAAVLGRLDLARTKGCDGVEPDNVDGYANETGFPLDAQAQLSFNRAIAEAAHARGLAVALKNDLDQIEDLVDVFDLSVNEQCHEYDECELLEPFIAAGKPVFNAEYLDSYLQDSAVVCSAAQSEGLRTLILPLDLDDAFRVSCDEL